MKSSSQITGLPIISISDGVEVGKVKSLVINPEKGSIDFLTIDNEDWQVSIKAVPFKKVVGIGEYAVTVESESAVIDLNEIPITNQLVNKKIKITNTKVMTRKGELLGTVTEFFVDDNSGNILGMELEVGNNKVALHSEFVLTFGKDIIIVKEDSSSHFMGDISDLDANSKNSSQANTAEIIENAAPSSGETAIEAGSSNYPIEDEVDMKALKEKQIEILNGKRILKDIHDTNGNILFQAGTVLTPEDIEKAQEEGPNVLVDISMNVQA
ncbi:PRC-barrel domain-containing protein [Bacillus rubiinfantis]|uniref:PRC-barrel domain-containing protein n=1 Tax=Bacillus rubiinfantis TaxID=1499680 RepID=UPI0005A895F7|nr:PRC-barrel domain-containing protein [Bacillus rubiinfantis]